MRLDRRWWCRLPYRYIALTLAVVGLDQATKFWAVAELTDALQGASAATLWHLWHAVHPRVTQVQAVWPSFWHFRYVENPGAAWSLLSNSSAAWRTPFFLCVSVCAMASIVAYFRKTAPYQWLLRMCLAMIMGGAIGNFIDRARLGYVIDFIDWHYFEGPSWPTFNVADAAITAGVLTVLLETYIYGGQGAQAPSQHQKNT